MSATKTTRVRKPRTVKVSDVVAAADNAVSSVADVKPATDPAGADLSAPAGSVAERDAKLAKVVTPAERRTIGAAVKVVRDLSGTIQTATTALGFARVRLGAALLPVFQTLTADPGEYRWKESSAMEHILTTYLSGETGPDGKPYAAATVRAWIVAGEQESLLPKEQRDKFGSDAHRTFARVRKAKGDKRMVTFATGLAKKGDVSVGKVRAAYDKSFPAADKPEISPASEANEIQTGEIESATVLRSLIGKLGIESSVLIPVLNIAAGIGQRHPDASPEALLIALRFLAKEPKKK